MSKLNIPQNLPVFTQEGSLIRPTHLATGPWYPGTQHGSAMMLMAAIAAERVPTEVPRQVTRLTVDMLSAAPLEPIEFKTDTRKGGRNLEALDISILSGGKEYVHVSALRYRLTDIPVAARMKYNGSLPVLPRPLPRDLFESVADREGFHHAIEIRFDFKGDPTIMWFRLKQPVLDDLPVTPLQRVALACDWTYSVPSFTHRILTGEGFDNQTYYGINPDTTINMHRPAEGEWIGIQTHACYDDLGAGTVMARIYDERGVVGFSTQTILIRGSEAAPMQK